MLSLVTAMTAVLVAWSVLGVLLLGLGCLALAWAPKPEVRSGYTAFWLGYLVAIALLQVWHLFAPVGAGALAALCALSASGLALRGAPLLRTLRHTVTEDRRFLACSAMFLVWLANRALGPPVGDAGLYHLSAVRWFSTFPIVPGIANLHYRLGFNNPSLLWSALLEIGPWTRRSSHIANGILLAAVGLRALLGLSRALRRNRARPADLFAALLLPVVVGQAVSLFELRMSGPDPDAAAGLVALACATHLVALLTAADADAPARRVDAFAALSLSVLAACIKISMAPFSIGVALVCAWAAFRRRSDRAPAPMIASLVAGTVLVVPWLIRGVISSGYPLFPLTALPLPVDWRMPRAEVELVLRLVHEHFLPPIVQQMRGPGEGWIRPWLIWQATRLPELVLLPAAVSVVGIGLLGRGGSGRARAAAWMLLPAAAGISVWLSEAPHPRFAYPFFWAAAAALVTAAGFDDLDRRGSRRRAVVIAVLLAAPVLPLAHRIVAWTWFGDPARAVESVVLAPGPDHGFFPTPTVELRVEVTRSGLAVHVPETGDQVWDAPLPATPALRPVLTLRHPADLGRGFRLER